MTEHCQQIAQRQVLAYERFAATICDIGGCDRSTGIKVAELYAKLKMVKIDSYNGELKVKHGAYLDASTITNAIAQVSA